MSDRFEYEACQASWMAAHDAIDKAAGVTATKAVERPVCLVTSLAERADLSPGALLCRMTLEVSATLAQMGFHEPVSLRQLPGLWWVASIDAAAENPCSEACGRMVSKVVSSEEILYEYGEYFCEVIAGPFSERPEC